MECDLRRLTCRSFNTARWYSLLTPDLLLDATEDAFTMRGDE